MRGNNRHGSWLTAAAWLAFLAGLALFLWQPVSNWVSQEQMNRQIATLPSIEEAPPSQGGEPSAQAEPDGTLQAFEAYNERVRNGQAGAINDPFSTAVGEGLALDASSQGLIGSIEIPKMGCSLPLYFGATDENMSKGASVVAGTSLPLGELDSNCVVAAHRGWTTAAMFRDIEDLEVGDDVYVSNYWETLHYRVAEICVVNPDDTGACAVQQGRDLLTLLTCHPYGVHPSPSRMLVYCDRVPTDTSGEPAATALPAPDTSQDERDEPGTAQTAAASTLLSLERALFTLGCLLIATFILWAALSRERSRRDKKTPRNSQAPQSGRHFKH